MLAGCRFAEGKAVRLSLTKLEAARRQLETAVELWFRGGDPIAIHTLASAGSDVLRDVAKANGYEVAIGTERLLTVVKPEYHDEVDRLLRNSQNYLKHADRDPDGVLEFDLAKPKCVCWTRVKPSASLQPPLQPCLRPTRSTRPPPGLAISSKMRADSHLPLTCD